MTHHHRNAQPRGIDPYLLFRFPRFYTFSHFSPQINIYGLILTLSAYFGIIWLLFRANLPSSSAAISFYLWFNKGFQHTIEQLFLGMPMPSTNQRRPFSKEDQEKLVAWLEDAHVASVALPLKLHENYTLSSIKCACSHCNSPLLPENIFFKCSYPSPDIAVIDARGGCMQCKTLNAYLMRIRGNGSFDRLVNHRWESGVLTPDRIAWWDLINQFRYWRRHLFKSE